MRARARDATVALPLFLHARPPMADMRALRAIVLFWSAGGNTRKVAEALHATLGELGLTAELREIDDGLSISYYDWDLILLGAPVYQFLPPKPVMAFLKDRSRTGGQVSLAAPERAGRFGVVFCTYSGPHTGIREAVPALKYMGQFLEHAGIPVVDEWAVVGEFHGDAHARSNLEGRLGDIRGRPNEGDLKEVSEKLRGLLRRLEHKLPG